VRTPNSKCIICEKPLYRRPGELSQVRHVACMAHRAQAQVLSGITDAQMRGLSLGRAKGTNHLDGIPKSKESNQRRSSSHLAYWAAHPEQARERGAKIRGEKNWHWNGGSSRFNTSIRQMTEHRKWMEGVRARDGKCLQCGRADCLESHHIVPLAEVLRQNNIANREQARACSALWDLSNGVALCIPCHYSLHGRHYAG